jgi:hypothetical protein
LNTAKVINFLIKHGIGAPGPMAEAQPKTYMKLRQAHTGATAKGDPSDDVCAAGEDRSIQRSCFTKWLRTKIGWNP